MTWKFGESILLGNAVIKVIPTYPPSARGIYVYGEVEVQVTVSEERAGVYPICF